MIILYFGGKKIVLMYFTACVKSIFKFIIKGRIQDSMVNNFGQTESVSCSDVSDSL